MSFLENLATDDTIEEERDSVGGGGPLESGLYKSTVKLAYINKAASGALGLVLHFATEAGQNFHRTLWMTSVQAKGGNNFYTDKNGQKQYLPGFVLANSLALLTVGQEISELETETKVINAWSPEAKAEVPTKVEMLVDLLGKEIITGLIKQTVDKTQKNDAGVYEPTGETRDENEIDKFFRARDSMTVIEIRAKADVASFIAIWEAKWEGKTRDKTKGADANAEVAGALKAARWTKTTTSLFA